MLHCLVYASKAARLMENDDLLHLLQESRNWNETHGLTGLLLYVEGHFLANNEGRFMQVLEGTPDEINLIFDKIKTDERHHQVTVLNQQPIAKRHFKTWSMGFNSLKLEEHLNTPGFFNPDDYFKDTPATPTFNVALNFMKTFYDMNRQYDFHSL
ncbi:BLUF domain-containing protein [Mucilaginibacter sp. PAMB04274]|uniref:BLUF domain-containing protein n=1 Tax=Mucilaginibacter sp. PAMB04274 TaxID=3138568 RepID=UPI0031F642E1